MVNKTQFYKTKVALAVVLSLGLSACGDDSTSHTDATQPLIENVQKELSVTVSGGVFDTNNNPIIGASVFLANETAVTDAGGIYTFTNVDVINVAGANNEGGENDDTIGKPLTLTVVGPEGYLGGTITITPEAQVNNTGGQSQGQNGGNSDTTTQVYISGLSYGVEKVVLPELTAKVTGYLTDCSKSYESYDQVIEGAVVAADILSLGADATETATPGATFELSAQSLSTTTDANGMFTITLPADSVVNLLADGWGLDINEDEDADDLASTNVIVAEQTSNNEQVTENIGIIQVCPFATPDTTVPNVAPMFSSIDGQTTLMVDAGFEDESDDLDDDPINATFVGLDEGIVNDFAINFSEALPNMTTEDVRVYLVTDEDGEVVQDPTTYAVTLNADFDGIVITFNEDLEDGSKVEVAIAQWLAEDVDDAAFVDNTTFTWDSVSASETRLTDLASAKAQYASARFCTFKKADPLNGEASITLIEQIIDADATEDGDSTDLSDYSSVFADNLADNLDENDDPVPVVDQLNSDEPETVAARLTALAFAIEEANGDSTGITHVVNQAEVTFENATGTVTVAATVGNPDPEDGLTDDGSITVTDTADGAVVTATAKNVFAVTMATSSVTVMDKIAPTTVLQESYNINDEGAPKAGDFLVASGGSAAVQFGDGGEVTGSQGAVIASVGNPIIYVQPRHLVGRNAGLSAAIRGSEFDALTDDMPNRLTDDESGDLHVINGRPAYDASAYAAWGAISQNIGIAISEDSTVVSGAALGTANISTAITAPTALMDTAANVDGDNVTDVDLVQVTVADVVGLANTDHGGTISLSGVIQDTAGTPNVADAASNAQVVLEDAFPPMVVDARWNGTTIAIQFNEAIELPTDSNATSPYLSTTIDMQLVNPANSESPPIYITLNGAEDDVDAVGYFSWDATTNTLTVNTDATVSGGWAGNATTEGEFLYDDDLLGDADEEQHAVLVWDQILDTHGNRWADYHSDDLSSADTGRWAVNAPQFLAVNELGQFNVAWAWSGVSGEAFDTDGVAQVRVTFSHPLDTGTIDTSGSNGVQPSELAAMFTIALDGATATSLASVNGDLTLSLSADERTVTIDLDQGLNAIEIGTSVITVGAAGSIPAESALTEEIAISNITLTATNN